MIRLNHKYLFAGVTRWLFMLLLFVFVLGLCNSADILSGYHVLDMNRTEEQMPFFLEAMMIEKILGLMFLIYAAIVLNLEAYMNLAKYLVDRPLAKERFILCRFVYMGILSLFTFGLLSLILAVFVKSFTPYRMDHTFWVAQGLLVLEGWFFMTLTNAVMGCLRHLFVGLVPFGLFWFMEMNTVWESIRFSPGLETLYTWIPNTLSNGDYPTFYHPVYTYLPFLLIWALTDLLLYRIKDIR